MLTIGLTGGILAGKSTISSMLSDRGAVVIDADRLAHDAYRPHTDIWQDLVDAFGDAILSADGEIDRSRLADIVFSDRSQLDRLNAIVHPPLRRMVQSELQRLRGEGADVVVLEAAVLVEAGWSDLVDEVWVASAPAEVAVQRLQGRSGLSQQQARARIRSQLSPEERAQHADVVIDTACPISQTREAVARLWAGLKDKKDKR